jgi:RNA polymerase sigma factor (sigma-70 family)
MSGIEPALLAEWFGAFSGRLVLYARQWLGEGSAEDAVQEAFASLAAQGQAPRSPQGWLFRAVRNAAIAAARKQGRRQKHLERIGRSAPLLQFDPADVLDAASVEQALAELDPDRREVVVLKVWGGLSLKEIAEVTGRAISTLWFQYRGALDDLRRKMGEACPTSTKRT